mmetsp:Transcript_24795/g.58950  ORF Transcript_24795/g.58950 Transcript_24795/m.58950 type:complete len:267 (+) Transcript_24795:580-1380(+)
MASAAKACNTACMRPRCSWRTLSSNVSAVVLALSVRSISLAISFCFMHWFSASWHPASCTSKWLFPSREYDRCFRCSSCWCCIPFTISFNCSCNTWFTDWCSAMFFCKFPMCTPSLCTRATIASRSSNQACFSSLSFANSSDAGVASKDVGAGGLSRLTLLMCRALDADSPQSLLNTAKISLNEGRISLWNAKHLNSNSRTCGGISLGMLGISLEAVTLKQIADIEVPAQGTEPETISTMQHAKLHASLLVLIFPKVSGSNDSGLI